jgi:PEP-CTERM motif-containing protein
VRAIGYVVLIASVPRVCSAAKTGLMFGSVIRSVPTADGPSWTTKLFPNLWRNGKMKKLVICVAVLAMVWTSSAMAVDVPLVNAGFEDPVLAAGGKIKGFDGVVPGYTLDVPGWYDDCPSGVLNRSGVKTAEDQYVRTGNQGANLCPANPGTIPEAIVWQLTNQTISAGDIYTLSVWSKYDSVSAGIDVILDVSLFYDDGAGNHIWLNSDTHTLSETVAQACPVGFTIPVGHDSIGNKLGIKFENLTDNESNGWLHIDDVTLDVVPEPATMMLLGLGSLALLKRRRA